MHDTFRFEQNLAGINQVLGILPGCVSLNFNPPPLCRHPCMSGSSETVLILAGHCFGLLGDFRHWYEYLLATSGVEACVQFYLDQKPEHGAPCSSPRDPWEMLGIARENFRRTSGAATSARTAPVLYEVALAV